MDEIKVTLDKGGVVVIPAEYRKALGWREGDSLILSIDDKGIRIASTQAAISRAQDLVRQYIPQGRHLVDELIAERRLEAGDE